jgi:hypothetical protein
MYPMPIPRYIRWLAALAALVLCVTFLLWSRLVWTPVQRYYFGTYFRCSWPGFDPASPVEVRWIYMTAPSQKPELALDGDAIQAPSSNDRQIPMELSPAARQAGWTGLMKGPEERLQISTLKPILEGQFFDGESLWILLLLPLLCGFLLYLSLLIVWVKYEDWIDSIPWPAEWIDLSELVRSLYRKCRNKVCAIQFRMPELKKYSARKTALMAMPKVPAVAPVEPPKKFPQVAFSPFGATDGTPKVGFVWNEKNEID